MVQGRLEWIRGSGGRRCPHFACGQSRCHKAHELFTGIENHIEALMHGRKAFLFETSLQVVVGNFARVS
jgi:hypothetical protein